MIVQTLEVSRPRPHMAQEAILADMRRFNVVVCGRRFGKTKLAVNRAMDPLLAGYPVGWFAPTYRILLDAWRELRTRLQPVIRTHSQQEMRIELITGGVLEAWTLDDPNAGRSRRYKRAIIDEAGLARYLEEAWTAAIRPTLTDFRGDADFYGTPKGRNYFSILFQRGLDPGYPDWAAFQLPTSANPYIDPAEIEEYQRTEAELKYRQEYLAEFIEADGAVFRRIYEAIDTGVWQEQAFADHQYTIGVDWGKSNDFTVLTVVDMTLRAVVHIDRFNKIDYLIQRERLLALCERFNPRVVIPELNSIGVPIVEQLQREGLPLQPFQTTNATKAEVIDALALSFERSMIRIPDYPSLVNELLAYESERLPSGLTRYSAPEGMHDDCVMSLALAWQMPTPAAAVAPLPVDIRSAYAPDRSRLVRRSIR